MTCAASHGTVASIPQHIGCRAASTQRGDHLEGLRCFFLGKQGDKVCVNKHTIEIRVDDFQIKGFDDMDDDIPIRQQGEQEIAVLHSTNGRASKRFALEQGLAELRPLSTD